VRQMGQTLLGPKQDREGDRTAWNVDHEKCLQYTDDVGCRRGLHRRLASGREARVGEGQEHRNDRTTIHGIKEASEGERATTLECRDKADLWRDPRVVKRVDYN
jgi:hypothetical protein